MAAGIGTCEPFAQEGPGMVDHLVWQSHIVPSMFSEASDTQHPRPARDADPQPDPPPDDNSDETDRSWIDELAAALRDLARKGTRPDDGDPATRKANDEP